jgi:hypothetical protein
LISLVALLPTAMRCGEGLDSASLLTVLLASSAVLTAVDTISVAAAACRATFEIDARICCALLAMAYTSPST